MSETVRDEVAVDGGSVPVWVSSASGDATALPGLIVVPSIFGPHADLAAQMRSLGEVATTVILDPFWRAPNDSEANTVPYGDHEPAMARLAGFDFGACLADLDAVADWLRPRTNGRLAGLGICFGGSFVLLGADSGTLAGVVTWHGSRMESVLDRLGDLSGMPLRFHFGDADPVTPPEAIDAIRARFEGHPDCSVVVHPGAEHGFSHEGAAWDPSAASAGLADLREVLVALG